MSNLLKNLLFALGLAVILWFGYSLFLKDDEVPDETALGTGQGAQEAQAFVIRIRQLENIDLDGALFEDDRFKSLVNFRQDLGQDGVGRENPFAPVE